MEQQNARLTLPVLRVGHVFPRTLLRACTYIRTQCFWTLPCAATVQVVEVQPDASEDPLIIRRKPGTKRVGVEWYGSVDGDSNGRALFIKRKSRGVSKNTFAGSISKVMHEIQRV